LSLLEKNNGLTAERWRNPLELHESARLVGECGSQVRGHWRLATLALNHQRDFDRSPSVNLQLAPDAAVTVHAVAPSASRHERVLHRQSIDPPAHRHMLGFAAGIAANLL